MWRELRGVASVQRAGSEKGGNRNSRKNKKKKSGQAATGPVGCGCSCSKKAQLMCD